MRTRIGCHSRSATRNTAMADSIPVHCRYGQPIDIPSGISVCRLRVRANACRVAQRTRRRRPSALSGWVVKSPCAR